MNAKTFLVSNIIGNFFALLAARLVIAKFSGKA